MEEPVNLPTEAKKRRRYTREYKERVLAECAEPGVSIAAVARRHGINDNMIYNWRAALRQRADDFVQLPLSVDGVAPTEEHNQASVQIELPSSRGVVTVRWPIADIDRSVPWLRALMR